MEAPRRATAALLAVVAAVALTAPAATAAPRRIDLPRGFQPEGVTTDGAHVFVGSLDGGAVLRVDPATGRRQVLVPRRAGRVAVGLDYDRRRDLVWVAGGPTGTVRAFDADTGSRRATYRFPSSGDRFVNDLVVTRRGVYATDSSSGQLLVVPFRHGRLPGPARARTLPVSGDFVLAEGFNLNGIVRYHGWLLAVQTETGDLFRINKKTGRARTVRLGGYRLDNGDGLELHGRTLYAVRNQDERIAVVRLGPRARAGEVVAELYSRRLDVPSTVARVGRWLWAVDARFGTPSPETAAYWLTRLKAY